MKNIKYELQHIIVSDGQNGTSSQLKKTQNFLKRNVEASIRNKNEKPVKGEEEICLIEFAEYSIVFIEQNRKNPLLCPEI